MLGLRHTYSGSEHILILSQIMEHFLRFKPTFQVQAHFPLLIFIQAIVSKQLTCHCHETGLIPVLLKQFFCKEIKS
jgi:hypothetical protein